MRTTVKVTQQDGTQVEVEAIQFRTVPGLAVTRGVGTPGWTVTHTHSGASLIPVCVSRTSAEHLMRDFAALPVDWTQSIDEVGDQARREGLIESLRRLRQRAKHEWRILLILDLQHLLLYARRSGEK